MAAGDSPAPSAISVATQSLSPDPDAPDCIARDGFYDPRAICRSWFLLSSPHELPLDAEANEKFTGTLQKRAPRSHELHGPRDHSREKPGMAARQWIFE